MYRVRNTFLAKEFGYKTAVGIATSALVGNGKFNLEIIKRPGEKYFQDKQFLRDYNSHYWVSPRGKECKILPLDIFNKIETGQIKLL